MKRLVSLVLQLVGAAVIIAMFTAAMICLDGLVDQGSKADIGLVLEHPGALRGGTDPVLDRAIKLFNDGAFTMIIVSGSANGSNGDQPVAMAEYLTAHGLSANVILQDHGGANVPAIARATVKIMKLRQMTSVMVVSDYYRITRMKVALYHEGMSGIDKAHIGNLGPDDAVNIGKEVVALYDYVARTMVLPTAMKVKDEALVEMDKAKSDADKAKQKVDKGFNSLSK